MAILLAIAELYCRHRRVLADMTLLDAMVVGIAQIGALIPGVSRSGSTLTAALFLDLKREEAARFSFLLGIPAIALAGLKELYELHKAHLDAQGWSVLAVGLIVGSISAFVAIALLLRILERFSTWPFVDLPCPDRHPDHLRSLDRLACLKRNGGLGDWVTPNRNVPGSGCRDRTAAAPPRRPWCRRRCPPRPRRRNARRL